jgi:farnesyl diphosphate synthase/geranylgeranyl diphosphate synthase type II
MATERGRVESALARALAAVDRRVDPSLRDPVRHGVLGGGKRLRPILCVASYEACGGRDLDRAADLGAAVEMIHAYSLMHDDLPCMDDADLRRGQPTTHRLFGGAVTMAAGAALIPLALTQALDAARALECGSDRTRLILGCLAAAAGAGGMVGGQFLDLMGEGQALDAESLTELHRRKTGALITAPLEMGGLAAGASDRRMATLRRYGSAVGLAFQIADDILDATSDADALGKNPSDAELEKSTYVGLFGLEEAGRRANALVADAVGALRQDAIDSPPLEAIARFIVNRRS